MWPNISQAVEAVGGHPRYVRLDHDAAKGANGGSTSARSRGGHRAAHQTLFIGTPGNPTGWVISDAEIKALLEIARRRGVAIIADEVYSLLFFRRSAPPSFIDHAAADDNVFVVNSFSEELGDDRLADRLADRTPPSPRRWRSFRSATIPASPCSPSSARWRRWRKNDGFIAEMVERCRTGRRMVGEFIARQNRLSWVGPRGAFYGYIHNGRADGLGRLR